MGAIILVTSALRFWEAFFTMRNKFGHYTPVRFRTYIDTRKPPLTDTTLLTPPAPIPPSGQILPPGSDGNGTPARIFAPHTVIRRRRRGATKCASFVRGIPSDKIALRSFAEEFQTASFDLSAHRVLRGNERFLIILSQRSGRGPRPFDRCAVPNDPASRRSRSDRHNNQGREYNKVDRQSRQ
jgi:hypothetical protein